MKTKNYTESRLIIYPRYKGDFGFCTISGTHFTVAEQHAICEGIESQVRKHISKSEHDRGDTQVEDVYEEICGYCGRKWTEKGSTYNGGCCNADEADEQKREAAMTIEELTKYVRAAERTQEIAEEEADRRRAILAHRKAADLVDGLHAAAFGKDAH